jgi:hypothetical protein
MAASVSAEYLIAASALPYCFQIEKHLKTLQSSAASYQNLYQALNPQMAERMDSAAYW